MSKFLMLIERIAKHGDEGDEIQMIYTNSLQEAEEKYKEIDKEIREGTWEEDTPEKPVLYFHALIEIKKKHRLKGVKTFDEILNSFNNSYDS